MIASMIRIGWLMLAGLLACGPTKGSAPPTPRTEEDPSNVPVIVPVSDRRPDELALEVHVFRWSCRVHYPGGTVAADLHVPVGRAIRLKLISKDLEHAVELGETPLAARVSYGAWTELAFEAARSGTFSWKCPTDVAPGQPPESAARPLIAEAPDAFAAYLAKLQRETNPVDLADRIALGRKLSENKGCVSCHAVDGSTRVGPSWRGIWGTKVRLADGSERTVDAAYVEASIVTPAAFARPGYPPGTMPRFEGQLKPVEIAALTAYIQSLAQ